MEKINDSIDAQDYASHTIKNDIDPWDYPSPYTFLRIRQTVQLLKLGHQGWKPSFVYAVKQSMRHPIPPNLGLGSLESRSNLSIDPATLAWGKEHSRQVDEGNDAWIRVFGKEMEAEDIELSDEEDEPAVSTSHPTQSTRTPTSSWQNKIQPPCPDAARLAWSREHARHVDEGNMSWVKVFGEQLEADDIELSDEEGPDASASCGTTSARKASQILKMKIVHELADCVYTSYCH